MEGRTAQRPGAAHALARVATRVEGLGLGPPPVALQLRLARGTGRAALVIQPQAPCRPADIVRWVEPWRPVRIDLGVGILRAEFDPLPAAWSARDAALDLRGLVVSPGGDAVATIYGPQDALRELDATLLGAPVRAPSRRSEGPREFALLTAAQDAAVRAAVESGYYRIPRPLNLNDLAQRLGISSASLSERLRRAEARIMTAYADHSAVTASEAGIIFNGPGQER